MSYVCSSMFSTCTCSSRNCFCGNEWLIGFHSCPWIEILHDHYINYHKWKWMWRAYNLGHWKWWLRAEVNPNSSIGGKSLVPVVGTIIRLRSLGLFCFVLFCLGVIILRCRRLPKTGRGIAGNLSIDLNHFRSCNRKLQKVTPCQQLVLCSLLRLHAAMCVWMRLSGNIAFHSKPWPN